MTASRRTPPPPSQLAEETALNKVILAIYVLNPHGKDCQNLEFRPKSESTELVGKAWLEKK